MPPVAAPALAHWRQCRTSDLRAFLAEVTGTMEVVELPSTAAPNAWLRSAGGRVEFDREQVRVDLGDLKTMLPKLQAGPAAMLWCELFAALGPGQV